MDRGNLVDCVTSSNPELPSARVEDASVFMLSLLIQSLFFRDGGSYAKGNKERAPPTMAPATAQEFTKTACGH